MGRRPTWQRASGGCASRIARDVYDGGTIRIVSPLDSASTSELEITEEQEAWLRWMIDNRIERIRFG